MNQSNAAKHDLLKQMENNPIYQIESSEYNKKLADALKQMPEFERPEWSLFVKTSVSRIRPPSDDDFWHKRAASILRQIYLNKVVGVNRLKTRYGAKMNRGVRPSKFHKASGKIIRVILQQAEKAGLLEKVLKPKAGRIMSKKGKEFLESIK